MGQCAVAASSVAADEHDEPTVEQSSPEADDVAQEHADGDDAFTSGLDDRQLLVVTKPLPKVLIMHTGGTLGMDPTASYEPGSKGVALRRGTGGVYAGVVRSRLQPTALHCTS